MIDTLSYDPGRYGDENGWVSRYSYVPEWMIGLNSTFYSFKNGDIYQHDYEGIARATFYGVKYPVTITTEFNESPLEKKMFKTIHIDSNDAWDAALETDLSLGNIEAASFEKKEGDYFAHVRRIDSTTILADDARSISTQGVGIVDTFVNPTITFTTPIDQSAIAIGDRVYRIVGPTFALIGTIDDLGLDTINVTVTGAPPVAGNFIAVGKNMIAESPGLRGYFMRVTLSNTNDLPVELFAVSSSVFKSYP
jgi:hypothetical protein